MKQQHTAVKPVHKELLHAKIADAIMEYIKAVSYTHLDVYKRQKQLSDSQGGGAGRRNCGKGTCH